MKVYDFDGTLYHGDSTLDFYLFCIKRHPALFLTIPANVANAIRFKTNRISRQDFKERFFKLYLPRINTQQEVDAFWRTHRQKLKDILVGQLGPHDVVASASPDFLLAPLCQTLDVGLVATEVDPNSGTFLSDNCRGTEKVRRFTQAYPQAQPEAFYTDDLKADGAMRDHIGTTFLVHGSQVERIQEHNDFA